MTPGTPTPFCRPLLPGLAGIARRHYDQLVGDDRKPFTDIGDLDQFLVATAFEHITEIACEVPPFRLRSVLDSTWTRLRAHAAAHRRDWDTLVPLGEATDRPAHPARTAAEELAGTLIDAVECRVLRPVDAGLVYATRVVGHTTADVASTLAWRTPSLLRRRHRVEQPVSGAQDGPRRGLGSGRRGRRPQVTERLDTFVAGRDPARHDDATIAMRGAELTAGQGAPHLGRLPDTD